MLSSDVDCCSMPPHPRLGQVENAVVDILQQLPLTSPVANLKYDGTVKRTYEHTIIQTLWAAESCEKSKCWLSHLIHATTGVLDTEPMRSANTSADLASISPTALYAGKTTPTACFPFKGIADFWATSTTTDGQGYEERWT